MPQSDAARIAGALLQAAIDERLFPAAVAEVGAAGGPIWQQAYGHLTFDADAAPADRSTIFDLASLTKPLATTTVVLRHVEAGRLALDDLVGRYVDEWRGADRAGVTIRLLLEHAGGLSPRLLDAPPPDRRGFEHEICTMPLEYLPGSRAVYTDLGFILLGLLAERIDGRTLATQVTSTLDAVWPRNPVADSRPELLTQVPEPLRARTAPTSPLAEDVRRGRRLVGEVHDNYAAALGGFAGHAGLFGTAGGVGAFARAMLRAVSGDSTSGLLRPATARLAISRSPVPGSSRALGWDTMRPTSSCGTRMSAEAFGHVGFTGTSLWIDPARDRYVVLLTNRVCEGGTSDQMQQVRRAFHDAVADL